MLFALSGCGGDGAAAANGPNGATPAVDTYPPDGMQCTAELSPSGTVPTLIPKAFAAICATCHGPAGYGGNGYPDLRLMLTFASFSGIVRNGMSGSLGIMPAFSTAEVGDDDLKRIYAFLTMSPIVETHQCVPAP
jgi:mono/diheme cytochrome c family protein